MNTYDLSWRFLTRDNRVIEAGPIKIEAESLDKAEADADFRAERYIRCSGIDVRARTTSVAKID